MKNKVFRRLVVTAISASMMLTAVPAFADTPADASATEAPAANETEPDGEGITPTEASESEGAEPDAAPAAADSSVPDAEPAADENGSTETPASPSKAPSKAPEAPAAKETAEETVEDADEEDTPTVASTASYNLDYGVWQENSSSLVKKSSGTAAPAGNTGSGLRLEGFSVDLNSSDREKLGLTYQAYIENQGWSAVVTDTDSSDFAGTKGQSLRMEALRMNLNGSEASNYDLYYSVYATGIGWLGWAKNGESAGTFNDARRLEGLRVQIVKKGEQPTVSYTPAYPDASIQGAKLSYTTHVQNIGWQSYVSNGATAGTSGKAYRLEGIKIKLEDTPFEGAIEYRTHVQNVGWQNYVSNDAMSGTSGKALRLEAIQIKLTGEVANYYDVYYRVHAQNVGWMDWTSNDELAGTEGMALRLEAIQIKLVAKNTDNTAPTTGSRAFLSASSAPAVSYRTHVQDYGWQGNVTNGATSGTVGQAKRLEGIEISLADSALSGSIAYRTHIQNVGWESGWKMDGAMSGTSGKALRLEAIQIKLTGELADYYDVYYRVHAQNFGWLGWAKNGQSAGTEGYAYRLEGIQIKVLPKQSAAPGSTVNAFRKYSNPMLDKAQGYSSSTNWLILTNLTTHRVAVFYGSQGNWKLQREFACSTGEVAAGYYTPQGSYTMGSRGYYFDSGTVRCFYYTQITGPYYFHSVLYAQTPTPTTVLDGRLGMNISHGCVRLQLSNAKWLYDTIPSGTRIIVYS